MYRRLNTSLSVVIRMYNIHLENSEIDTYEEYKYLGIMFGKTDTNNTE